MLHGIWGSTSDNVFVVGDGAAILHYNGTDWTRQITIYPSTTANLNGVWGSSATTVFAVGGGGTVLKTTNGGSSWSAITSTTSQGLNAIWGSSASDIFAVGDNGTIIHSDGSNWSLPMETGTTVKLLGVFGTANDDVYAVGNSHKDGYWKRTVLHYDGIRLVKW